MRKTKICCTIGPVSADVKTIKELIQSGMDVARLNFSHGSLHDHEEAIQMIRRASERLRVPVAIIQDLQGPKLRIGQVKNGSVVLKRGAKITIGAKRALGSSSYLWSSYRRLPNDVKPGDRILLDDGLIHLKVLSSSSDEVHCRVVEGGELASQKGINLPGVDVSLPAVTKKDKVDLSFGLGHNVDVVAVSFVRRAQDLDDVRRIIRRHDHDTMLVAKIEKPEAIVDMENILELCDGVIVARGDLGVEMALEKVPTVQRQILEACRRRGIPSVVATQMLESMRTHPRPTRAEVSDVANAIREGADALMLTAETAVGERPVQTLKMMSRIIRAAEQDLRSAGCPTNSTGLTTSTSDAVADSACQAAHDLKVKAIVTLTQSGYTALMISKYRPQAPIVAFTPNPVVYRQMNLFWGVIPRLMDFSEDLQQLFKNIDQILLRDCLAAKGDPIVVVMGYPLPQKGTTNLMTVRTVGD